MLPRSTRFGAWFPPVILAFAGAALWWIWSPDDPAFRQFQVLRTLGVSALVLFGLALWAWLALRGRRGLRLGVLLALAVAAVSLTRLVEFHGFSGDLVPQLAWRSEAAGPGLPDPPAPTPAPSPDALAAEPEPDVAGESPEQPVEAPEPGTREPQERPRPSYPQFLGPARNATLRGIRLARDWDSAPPERLWRQPIGAGWSGFAVAEGRAVTQEQREGREVVVAYDLDSGRVIWAVPGETRFESALAGDGPRATPTLDRGIVWAFGATGVLRAIDLQTGALLFARDVLQETGGRRPSHGVAASPLILGDQVVVLAGGPEGRSLAAYDRTTGALRWSGGDDPAAYSSPLLATLAGVEQIVVFNQHHVTGHSVEDGRVLWQHPWPKGSERVAQPVVLDDSRLFVSTGYGVGGQLLRIVAGASGLGAEMLWESRRLKAKFTQVVYHEGFLYGLDDGVMVCLDPADGERRWKQGRYGHGQILLVEDLLLVQGERGDVALVDPSPQELLELTRFQAVEGTAWATPALAGDLLLVRGDREAACYRLPMRSS
jgi:outer membrane protein assembly factor BamB